MGSESRSVHEPRPSSEDREQTITGGIEASTDGRAGPRLTRPAAHLRDGRALLLLALILVAAAAVRLVGIGSQSFSIDELAELRIAHSGIAEIVTFGDGIPPLYNLLVHFLLPLGDLAGRVLSALFGAATVAVTWAWARRIAGIRVGLYAAGLMALSPFAVDLSREGRAHGLLLLLIAASLWSLWVALEDTSLLRWARWGLVSALGVYTHYLFAVVIAASLVVALIEVRGRPSRDVWVGIGTLGFLAAPALFLLPGDMVVQLSEGLGAGIRLPEVMYAGYTLVAGFFLGPPERDLHYLGVIGAIKAAWIWIALVVPALGMLLVQGLRALDRVARRRLLILGGSGFFLLAAKVLLSGNPFAARYILWLAVPLAVWLAAGLAALGPRWRRVSATALLVVAVSSMVARSVDPHRQFDDFEGVAAYLESSGALEDPVLVSGLCRSRPIVYYIDRPLALALPDKWDPEIGRLGYYPDLQLGLLSIPPLESGGFGLADAVELVDAYTQPGQPYHLVHSEAFRHDPRGELLATLGARDGLTLVKSFAGMDVYRGVRAG